MGSPVLPQSLRMKLLLVLVAAVGVSQAAVTCDECQAAAQNFVSHLLTEESLAEQIQILKDNVCPQLGVDGCEGILDMVPRHGQLYFQPFHPGERCLLPGRSVLRKERHG